MHGWCNEFTRCGLTTQSSASALVYILRCAKHWCMTQWVTYKLKCVPTSLIINLRDWNNARMIWIWVCTVNFKGKTILMSNYKKSTTIAFQKKHSNACRAQELWTALRICIDLFSIEHVNYRFFFVITDVHVLPCYLCNQIEGALQLGSEDLYPGHSFYTVHPFNPFWEHKSKE